MEDSTGDCIACGLMHRKEGIFVGLRFTSVQISICSAKMEVMSWGI